MPLLLHGIPETCYFVKNRLDRPRKSDGRYFTHIAHTCHRNYTKITPMYLSADEEDLVLWSMDRIEP